MAYKVDNTKKTVTVDDILKCSKEEKEMITILVAGGYTLKKKSEKRAAKASERAKKDNLKDSDILTALKEDITVVETRTSTQKDKDGKDVEVSVEITALQKYKEIKATKDKGGGFFAAKKWYLDYAKEKAKKEEEAKKESEAKPEKK